MIKLHTIEVCLNHNCFSYATLLNDCITLHQLLAMMPATSLLPSCFSPVTLTSHSWLIFINYLFHMVEPMLLIRWLVQHTQSWLNATSHNVVLQL